MKAAIYSKGGDTSVLSIGEQPIPKAGKHELLVKVAASSVNPVDCKLRKAGIATLLKFPKTTGSDGSGCVVSAPASSKFKAGDLVYFFISPMAQHGTAAEYVAIPEACADILPKNVNVFDAASLPLVACTAWQALDKASPLTDKKVLIQAGSGGVGTIAIQLAKAQGAHVTTTCSLENQELCRSLGADVVIDYKNERFEDVARTVAPEGFDYVMNLVGGDYDQRSLQVVRHGGHFCSVMRTIEDLQEWGNFLKGKMLSFTGRLSSHTSLFVKPQADMGLQQLSRMIDDGRAKPVVSQVFTLDQIAAAHEAVERGSGTRGKVIVKVVEDEQKLKEGIAGQ